MSKLNIILVLCISWHVVQTLNQVHSVLLGDVKILTLYKGQYTQARRVAPIPQIKCVAGSAKCIYELDIVHCYNRGSDGIDIQWECMSDIPKKYKLGKFNVLCEGYDNPDDPYILTGSCGLEYDLELADNSSELTDGNGATRVALIVFVILMIFICIIICAAMSDDTSKKNDTEKKESSNNQQNNVIETKSCITCNKSFVRNYDISRSNNEYTCDECIKHQSSGLPSSNDTSRSINYGGTKRR